MSVGDALIFIGGLVLCFVLLVGPTVHSAWSMEGYDVRFAAWRADRKRERERRREAERSARRSRVRTRRRRWRRWRARWRPDRPEGF